MSSLNFYRLDVSPILVWKRSKLPWLPPNCCKILAYHKRAWNILRRSSVCLLTLILYNTWSEQVFQKELAYRQFLTFNRSLSIHSKFQGTQNSNLPPGFEVLTAAHPGHVIRGLFHMTRVGSCHVWDAGQLTSINGSLQHSTVTWLWFMIFLLGTGI